jgi:hypothetical protein
MVSYSRRVETPAWFAWDFLAQPAYWSRWAPHVRGAWGLGAPEVEPGRGGFVRLLGVLPVPARITAKREGRSWTWQVGFYEMEHRLDPAAASGCDVVIEVRAARALEWALAATYGPLMVALLDRFGDVVASAAKEAGPASGLSS